MSQLKFVNREEELGFLNKAYNSKRAEFIVIYGRRRVGKSELIVNFIEGRGVYFLCSTEGDKQNIGLLKEKIASFFNDDSIKMVETSDWRALFASLIKNVTFKGYTKEKKFVLAFDEFPFLITPNPNIPSMFQQVWEELKIENVMLIVCGSYISVMEKKVVGYDSPLYGRNTGVWQLEPLAFETLHEFLDYSIEELLKVWFIIGGIPAYLLEFNPDLNFEENIKENFFKKGRFLYLDVEFILSDELREPRNYKLILKSISLGHHTLGSIVNFSGLDKSMVSKYIDVLKSLGIVKEALPVTATPKFRRRLYYIADPYFNFWFRFIYSNKIDIEAHRTNDLFIQISKELNQYFSFMFEFLVEDVIRRKIFFSEFNFYRIGKQWGKFKGEKGKDTYEIDIAAINERSKEILFAECKWQDNVDAEKILGELKEKSKFVEWDNEKRKEYFAIFAKSFKKKIKEEGLFLFDLKDMERIFKQP